MQNQIPKNWQKVKLGDLIEINPNQIGSNYSHENIEYIDISSVGTGVLETTMQYKLSEAPGRAKRLVKDGDTIISTVRPNRRSFLFIKQPKNNLIVSTGFAVLSPKSNIMDPKFLYYLVTRQSFTDYLSSNVRGSAYPAISTDVIGNAEAIVPNYLEQKQIASVFSSLDDKIELNNKIAKILEEMAQALFKEWFIKFKFPGYEKAKMVDSELGKIPKRWVIGKLEDICEELNSGGTPSTTNNKFYDGNIDWFSTKELNDGFLLNSEKKISNDGLNSSSAKIFPKGSVVMAIYAAPTVGRLGILTKESTFNQAACGFYANEQFACNEYIYLFLLSSRAKLNNMANGVAQQNLNVGLVRNFPILIPDVNTMSEFKLIIHPIFSNIFNISLENQKLVAVRDLLLPKLMKGEVKV